MDHRKASTGWTRGYENKKTDLFMKFLDGPRTQPPSGKLELHVTGLDVQTTESLTTALLAA